MFQISLCLGEGCVIPIRSDGHCCYHLAATIVTMAHNQAFVDNGRVPCMLIEAQRARALTLSNCLLWQAECEQRGLNFSEEHLKTFVDTEEVWRKEVTGIDWGGDIELALCLRGSGIRVCVVNTRRLGFVPDEQACHEVTKFEVIRPTKVVCALLGEKH